MIDFFKKKMDMRLILGKQFNFEASHQLPNEPCYGQCSHLHGHRYELTVEIIGTVNEQGWVCNFAELKQIVHTHIISQLDHSHLNQKFLLPTVENIVIWIFETLDHALQNQTYQLHKIKLYETATSYAELSRQESNHSRTLN